MRKKFRILVESITITSIAITYRKKLKKGVEKFAQGMKREAAETKEASTYIAKHMRGEKLTKEESDAVKQQFYDVLKMVGIGVPIAVIPGGAVLMGFIIKIANKHNISLTPSGFNDDNKENGTI